MSSSRRIVRGAPLLLALACHGKAPAASDAGPAPASSVAAAPSSSSPSLPEPPSAPIAAAPVTVASGPVTIPLPPPASSGTFPPFRRTSLSVEELGKLVSAAPELSRVGGELSFFDPNDGAYIVRSSQDHTGVVFSAQPLLWSPEPGQQVLVVTARGKQASFVAAWWLLPDGGYRLASTFVMLGEVAPVALAYRPTERALLWTSCWLCPGESGHLSVRDDHHVVIVQD